jgi:hypothetical protein
VEAFEQQPKVDAAAADAMWTAMLQAKETQQVGEDSVFPLQSFRPVLT